MKKKYLNLFIFLIATVQFSNAQEVKLKKGSIIESVVVQDSISETFSLYIPTAFEMKDRWPVLFIFDMDGKAKQAIAMFKNAAEANGYILAAPHKVHDSLSISQNMLSTKLVMKEVLGTFPINNNRIYAGGFDSGARFANLVPVFVKGVKGVLSLGASLVNTELLTTKNTFHFIAVVGNEDFNYTTLLEDEKVLNKLKFPNNILLFDGGNEWPSAGYVGKAMTIFNLSAMSKGFMPLDSAYVSTNFNAQLTRIKKLQKEGKLLLAERTIKETLSAFRLLSNTDSLRKAHRNLMRGKDFKSLNRNQNAALFKENLKREDYAYYLEEDVLTYNYNNLGWWNYQMTQINSFIFGTNKLEQKMGQRLLGYVNALVDDNINLVKMNKVVDEEALVFLLMLKTITEPNEHQNYLNVVSLAAKNNDKGTALFYLEELLKKGFKNKETIYGIEHTTLLRISPEFNKLVEKYLDDARYEIKDE